MVMGRGDHGQSRKSRQANILILLFAREFFGSRKNAGHDMDDEKSMSNPAAPKGRAA
jgi:hypothetical protein